MSPICICDVIKFGFGRLLLFLDYVEKMMMNTIFPIIWIHWQILPRADVPLFSASVLKWFWQRSRRQRSRFSWSVFLQPSEQSKISCTISFYSDRTKKLAHFCLKRNSSQILKRSNVLELSLEKRIGITSWEMQSGSSPSLLALKTQTSPDLKLLTFF